MSSGILPHTSIVALCHINLPYDVKIVSHVIINLKWLPVISFILVYPQYDCTQGGYFG